MAHKFNANDWARVAALKAELVNDDWELTVDMYTVHENVRIVDKKQVDICTMVVGEGTIFDVVASVGQDGSLYLLCEEAEELVL